MRERTRVSDDWETEVKENMELGERKRTGGERGLEENEGGLR